MDFDQLWQAYEKGFGGLNGKCSLTLISLSLTGQVRHCLARVRLLHAALLSFTTTAPVPKKHLITDELKMDQQKLWVVYSPFLLLFIFFSRRVLVGVRKDALHC